MDTKNNTGEDNSGYCNSGDCNSGNRNSGYYNSGDYNSGYHNSGNYNSGNYNSGMFNTDEPFMRMFNKETNIKFSDWVNSDDYIFYNIPLNTFIWSSEMTDKEKEEYPEWKTCGGYLKTLKYKEAWAKWWEDNKYKKDDIKRLPNFDAKIFEEITGIKIDEETEEMTMEEVCKALGRTIKIKK